MRQQIFSQFLNLPAADKEKFLKSELKVTSKLPSFTTAYVTTPGGAENKSFNQKTGGF